MTIVQGTRYLTSERDGSEHDDNAIALRSLLLSSLRRGCRRRRHHRRRRYLMPTQTPTETLHHFLPTATRHALGVQGEVRRALAVRDGAGGLVPRTGARWYVKCCQWVLRCIDARVRRRMPRVLVRRSGRQPRWRLPPGALM